MSDLNDKLFGPLSKQFCLYFYFLSMLNFCIVIFLIISTIIICIYKRRDGAFYLQMVMTTLLYAIFYFQNRILHTMCSNSL